MTLGDIFHLILYQPLFNALVAIYKYFPVQDFGIAVIILTLLIKIALYPLNSISIKAQKKLAQLQPKIEEVQKKYKDDKEKLVKETFILYKKEKINPFSGFLPTLVQLPILIAIFQVFWKGFGPEQMANLYSFLPEPSDINPFFMGLSHPNFILAFFAGIAQFWQTKMMNPKESRKQDFSKKNDFSKLIQKQMLYFFPVLTILILLKLPSAVGLYFLVASIFTILQQHLILKQHKLEQKAVIK